MDADNAKKVKMKNFGKGGGGVTFCSCENYLHQLRKLRNVKALLVA
jgi:hypothetical protein